ncbi:MAG: bifunctional oligoribonuclease/PAP phosphatase NrnA [Tannerella sp.]|jgi:phosphoesterase RecJ-like protein|nr:bifunctional oligoribonuclease/PAP phosphatase NrnA [Tannerella sp.]
MLTKIVDNDKIHKLKTYINKGSRFVIVSHEMPDGDAMGSSLGLYHYLTSFDKKSIKVVVPNHFPEFLKWMPGAGDIIIYDQYPDFAAQLISEADVLFCLDFNAVKRVGKMASAIVASDARKVMIDHHPDTEDFCSVVISYPEMSSTCELVFRVICALGDVDLIEKDAAECFYTGMMTDTGSFSYNSNSEGIYAIIGELIKKGVDKDEIYRKVNQVYSECRLRLMGYALYEKLKVFPDKQAALLTLTQKELNRFKYKSGDTEGFVNLPLSINGICFSVFMREETRLIKISLRSAGDFPCNEFASKYFNGGGHKNASGGEFYGTLEEAVKVFEEGLALYNPNNLEKS